MRILWLALLLVPLRADAGRCLSDAKANAALAAVAKQAAEHYAAALVQQRLAPVSLPLRTWAADRSGGAAPAETVIERVDAGSKVKVIAMGTRTPNCRYSEAEFVQAGTKVFRVVRKPRVTKTTKLAVCSCAPVSFSCGGAAMAPVAYGFVLPAGASYEGSVDVVYDAEVADVQYAVGRTTPCPRPAPPP